jgi:hypothetical protein
MSEQEGDRLSLEELARRLEALRLENEKMRSENAELRGEVRSKFEGLMSRRAFLGKAGASAVGAVTAGTLPNQRAAEAAQPADLKRFCYPATMSLTACASSTKGGGPDFGSFDKLTF